MAFKPWGGTPRGGSFGILPSKLFFRLPSSSSLSLPRRSSPSVLAGCCDRGGRSRLSRRRSCSLPGYPKPLRSPFRLSSSFVPTARPTPATRRWRRSPPSPLLDEARLPFPAPAPACPRSRNVSKCWMETQNRRIAGICLVGEEIRSGVGGVPRLIEGERARSKSARGGRRETEHGGTHRVVAQRPSLTIKPSAARGHHTHTSSKVSLRVRFC